MSPGERAEQLLLLPEGGEAAVLREAEDVMAREEERGRDELQWVLKLVGAVIRSGGKKHVKRAKVSVSDDVDRLLV